VFIATQLNSTELNSTSSCRHVHSVNNSSDPVDSVVGCDVINKNMTDLAVCCSTGSVQFSWVVSL